MDICDALVMISANAKRLEDERKEKRLDKIEALESIASLFEDNKDPLTAMELRRAAKALRNIAN